MPRYKKRGSSTPRGGRGGGRGAFNQGGRFSQSSNSTPPHQHQYLSLAEEARQTSRQNHSFWEQGSSLRNRPVKFVSAGTSEPLKQLDEEIVKAGGNQKNAAVADAHEEVKDEVVDDVPEPDNHAEKVAITSDPIQDIPIIDLSSQISDHDGHDSSSDKIIGPEELERGIEMATATDDDQPAFFFDLKGDGNKATQPREPVALPEHPELKETSSSEDEVLLFKGRDIAKSAQTTTISVTQMQTEIRLVEKEIQESSVTKKSLSVSSKVPGKLNSHEKRRKQRQRNRKDKNEDDDLIADYIANMKENGEMPELLQPDSRNRRDLGGTPSPIVSDRSEDESESPEVAEPSQSAPESQELPNTDSKEDTYESAEELGDEDIARLLANQGLGPQISGRGVEVSSSSDSDSSDDELATAEVPYDDFDLLDWNQPSLVSRSKKRKGKAALAQLNFGMSDSETEQKLRAAWKNDRLKKSERKRQREELRALGQLGRKGTSPDDLRVKYPTGMTLDQVADEFRTFLLSSDALLTYPPMDKHARKMIHELANKFNVKSKSAGKSDQRRTTLHRTIRTLGFQESAFNQALGRIHRKYFPRLDTRGKRSKGTLPGRFGSSGHAEASYQEGEVVGAAAPELGSDNRGRAMLEKMGWSSGDALGALNNKGILQPVAQTMKKSKAGLG